MQNFSIRPMMPTLQDAQGILAVDATTFGDCRDEPGQLLEVSATGGQRVWVAEQNRQVVGFVSAFATRSLSADRWEIDELAVHPQAQGQGIGTALVVQAVAGCPPGWTARTLIACHNRASQRAFARSGFAPRIAVRLLVYDVSAQRPAPGSGHSVRRANLDDAEALSRMSGCAVQRVRALLQRPQNVYWLADGESGARGFLELLYVQTLQYEGGWLEAGSGVDGQAIRLLFDAALSWGHDLGGGRPRKVGMQAPIESVEIEPVEIELVEIGAAAGLGVVGDYQVYEWR